MSILDGPLFEKHWFRVLPPDEREVKVQESK